MIQSISNFERLNNLISFVKYIDYLMRLIDIGFSIDYKRNYLFNSHL